MIFEEHEVTIIINFADYTYVDSSKDIQLLAELLKAKAVVNLDFAIKEVHDLLFQVSPVLAMFLGRNQIILLIGKYRREHQIEFMHYQ